MKTLFQKSGVALLFTTLIDKDQRRHSKLIRDLNIRAD